MGLEWLPECAVIAFLALDWELIEAGVLFFHFSTPGI